MKSPLVTILITTVLAGSALAQLEIPKIVGDGFNAYQNAGAKAAISAWLKASPMENDVSTRTNMEGLLGRWQTDYGKLVGFDLIRGVILSPSFERLYVLVKFEKGAAFASFDCYRASTGWIVARLNLNASASEVLPGAILSGSP
jgi:hypothetical protein